MRTKSRLRVDFAGPVLKTCCRALKADTKTAKHGFLVQRAFSMTQNSICIVNICKPIKTLGLNARLNRALEAIQNNHHVKRLQDYLTTYLRMLPQESRTRYFDIVKIGCKTFTPPMLKQSCNSTVRLSDHSPLWRGADSGRTFFVCAAGARNKNSD